MVFPELALSAGSLGSLGRFLRVRMDAIQRKVAIYDLNLFRIGVYQTPQQGSKPCTARSLKIAIFDNRHRGVRCVALLPIPFTSLQRIVYAGDSRVTSLHS